MKFIKLSLILLTICSGLSAQELKSKNIIVVTLDGYRWKELFEGADDAILSEPKYMSDPQVAGLFGGGSVTEKREKLMPFFWSVIARQGQLYGNRNFGNKVNCVNNHLLSYPGYSEMFVGHPDRTVSSNKRRVNPNATVFEFIQQHKGYEKKVAAFATWDLFPFILREERAAVYVNAGSEPVAGKISDNEKSMNESLLRGNKRTDDQTFQYAFEYLKRERPRVMFIGLDGTDHHAHSGRYDEYLKSANAIDGMINHLWTWVQSQPDYKDQTTLFITTDHGRGSNKHMWKTHQLLFPGSRHIWFAVMGPDTPAFGEMKFKAKYYQKQVAGTMAAFLGLRFKGRDKTGEVVQTMIGVPALFLTDDAATSRPRGDLPTGQE